MAEFDRKKLMHNINTLIRMQGLRIGEVETAVGISSGYLSRLSRRDTEAAPAIDLVWRLAQYFNVSVDALIEGDFSMADDNMQYFAEFLKNMRSCVDRNMIIWEVISLTDVDDALFGETTDLFIVSEQDDTFNIAANGIRIDRPFSDDADDAERKSIVNRKRKVDDWHNGKHWCRKNKRIYSSFFPDNKIWLTANAYRCSLDPATRVYIFKMAGDFLKESKPLNETAATEFEELQFYELYFEKREDNYEIDFLTEKPIYKWQIYPVCNTIKNAQNLEGPIDLLYWSIFRHENDLKLDQPVRDSIDKFLKDYPSEDDRRKRN